MRLWVAIVHLNLHILYMLFNNLCCIKQFYEVKRFISSNRETLIFFYVDDFHFRTFF